LTVVFHAPVLPQVTGRKPVETDRPPE